MPWRRAPARPGPAGLASPARGHPGQLPFGLHRGDPAYDAEPSSPPPIFTPRRRGRRRASGSAVAEPPRIAVVLGSGLNELADRITEADQRSLTIRFPISRAPLSPDMQGKCSWASSAECRAIMFQGRFHYYEGHDLETVTFPVRRAPEPGRLDLDPHRGHRRHPRRPAAGQPGAV